MAGQVQGKVALVTGGASGIGEAISELLAREGASVAVTDVDDLRGPEVVARIKKAGGEATFLHHDVTSEERWIEAQLGFICMDASPCPARRVEHRERRVQRRQQRVIAQIAEQEPSARPELPERLLDDAAEIFDVRKILSDRVQNDGVVRVILEFLQFMGAAARHANMIEFAGMLRDSRAHVVHRPLRKV